MPIQHLMALCLAAGLMGCATATPPATPPAGAPPHHRDGTFQNNYIDFAPKGLRALMQWRVDAYRAGLPPAPQSATPQVKPDLAFLHGNAGPALQPSVTWVGHATVLAQLGGLNLLTDPIFTERASPLGFVGPRRAQPPGVALNELPHIHAVLISHNHYDHLDEGSVRALNRQPNGPPVFIVPLGLKAWMNEVGVQNVVELDWWQTHRIGSTDVMLTPVQHWSGRSLTDRLETLWGGYAVFAPDCHLFFGGDTGYSKDFADVRTRAAPRQAAGGFDIALIPVGAYEPRWFMKEQHVNPDEALKIARDLGAVRSLGVHWGTFELTDEALDEPPRALAAAKRAQGVSDDAFFVLAIGETRRIPRRGTSK